jgi:hypothetical protein
VVYFSSQTNYVLYIVGTVELHDLLFWGLNLKMDDSLCRNILKPAFHSGHM